MNKKTISIIIGIILVFGITGGVWWRSLSPVYLEPPTLDYQDSPFGIHPATVVPPAKYEISNPHDYAIDIGIKRDRGLSFIWTLTQPDLTKEEYEWERYDQVVKDAPDSIRIMANIYIGSPRADVKYYEYAKKTSFLSKDEEAYKRFVRSAVERYDGDGIDDIVGLRVPIKYWQLDNEPPHGLEDYAKFLKITYLATKEADPEAKVIIGGVPGLGTPSSISDYA
ncbi:MAG TPA: hypothetical protein ENN38_07345 [Actinobacteria bacterium]|nr:hypothetical protein [Actinomycetota bacterium]